MKFNINTLTDAILDYMNKNEVQNPLEFPTLAFYKVLNESGLNDNLKLRLTTEDDGLFKIIQFSSSSIDNYIDLKIKDPSVPDPADDPKNKPIYINGRPPIYENVALNSNEDTSLNKRFVIRREQRNNADLNKVLTNEIKANKIAVYSALAKYDKFSELCDNIGEYQQMIHFGDKKLYDLSQAIFSYKEYQKSLKKDKPTDEIVIPSVLNKHLENILGSLITLTEKRAQYTHKNYNNLDKLADIIRGDVQFSAPLLLTGDDTFKTFGLNKHVPLTSDTIENVDLSGFVLDTIKKNADNGTPSNIIDDIYKDHISKDFKDEYALRLRMTEKQKTIEERLEHSDLNNFIEDLKFKFPYVFKDNELFSYRTGVLSEKSEYSTVSDVFNTFKLNDSQLSNCILAKFTDNYTITEKDLYNITTDERYIRFVGETDASVKSLATGVINQMSDTNDEMKMLKIYSLVFLNEADNQYNEMAFNEIFSYCAKNKLALYINLDNEPFDDSKLILQSTLDKVVANYKDSVLFIPDSSNTQLFVNMEECKTDMATFRKSINEEKNNKVNQSSTQSLKY